MKMKKYLILPLLMCVLLMFSACGNGLSINDYIASYVNLNDVTKVIQTTTVKDGATIASQTTNTIEFASNATKAVLTSRVLAPIDSPDLYEENEQTIYYTSTARYTFNGQDWIVETGAYAVQSTNFDLKEHYLTSIVFDNTIQEVDTSVLTASVLDASKSALLCVNDVDATNVGIRIELNKDRQITLLSITYTTASEKTVEIVNEYSYDNVVVTLPTV